jgi:transcriptional regulator of acetoin/glycerol metabolism
LCHEEPFAGNGRELRRLVERAAALADGPQVETHQLEAEMAAEADAAPAPVDLRTAVEDAERAAILSAPWPAQTAPSAKPPTFWAFRARIFGRRCGATTWSDSVSAV